MLSHLLPRRTPKLPWTDSQPNIRSPAPRVTVHRTLSPLRTVADIATLTAKDRVMLEHGRLAIEEVPVLLHGAAIRVEVPLATAKVDAVEEDL